MRLHTLIAIIHLGQVDPLLCILHQGLGTLPCQRLAESAFAAECIKKSNDHVLAQNLCKEASDVEPVSRKIGLYRPNDAAAVLYCTIRGESNP